MQLEKRQHAQLPEPSKRGLQKSRNSTRLFPVLALLRPILHPLALSALPAESSKAQPLRSAVERRRAATLQQKPSLLRRLSLLWRPKSTRRPALLLRTPLMSRLKIPLKTSRRYHQFMMSPRNPKVLRSLMIGSTSISRPKLHSTLLSDLTKWACAYCDVITESGGVTVHNLLIFYFFALIVYQRVKHRAAILALLFSSSRPVLAMMILLSVVTWPGCCFLSDIECCEWCV